MSVERIKALETALADAVVYLRSLPAHPATYRKANELETVLQAPGELVDRAGQLNSLQGTVLMRVGVSGSKVLLKALPTIGSDHAARASLLENLHSCLVAGAVIETESVPEGSASKVLVHEEPVPARKGPSELFDAVHAFAGTLGMESLILERGEWPYFYLDIPSEEGSLAVANRSRLKHLAWWFLAELFGGINWRDYPRDSNLFNRMIDDRLARMPSTAGRALNRDELGELIFLMFDSAIEKTEATASAFLDLLATVRKLRVQKIESAHLMFKGHSVNGQ